MDIKAIKELAQKFDIDQLIRCAEDLENTGKCQCTAKEDGHEAMSDVLQAMEVRRLLDSGSSLPDAVREFSRRVRGVLS